MNETDPLPASRGPSGRSAAQLIAEIALTLVLLCAVEAAFRWYVARDGNELYPALFRSRLTTAKFLKFRERVGKGPPLDLLIMGSSQMTRVHAGFLSEILLAKGCPASVFNFAAPSHSVAFDQLLLQRLVLDMQRPRVLLYGLMPMNMQTEPSWAAAVRDTSGMPGFQLRHGTAAAWMKGVLFDHVWLFRYREAVGQLVTYGVPHWKGWERGVYDVDARGDLPGTFLTGGPPRALNPDERKIQSGLRSYAQLLIQTPLFENVQGLANLCRAQGIQLVLMASPVAPIFLDLLPHGADDYRAFLERLQTIAAKLDVALLMPRDDGLGPSAYFADTMHNNAEGTRWLTHAVATLLTQSAAPDGQPVLRCDGANALPRIRAAAGTVS